MSETQNVEIANKQNFDSKNSFEEPIVETVEIPEHETTVTETEAAPIPEAPQNEAAEVELPEYAKRRLGKEQKKHQREIEKLKAELEQERARSESVRGQSFGAQSPQGYQDPLTDEFVDPSTPDGQFLSQYHQRVSQKIAVNEQKEKERRLKEIEAKRYEHFQDSFEDAKERYSDFEAVIKSSGMKQEIAYELADFPDPGELGYYLASNPREIDRLQKLPAYEMKRELARHMAEMVSKKKITQAPPPVRATGAGSGVPVKHFAHKTIAELKAERKAELSGESKKR